jgi:hypothetical protein
MRFSYAKRGASRLPFLSFSLRRLRNCTIVLRLSASDTHRMRGVIRLWFALSPVES